ncbi:MAG: chemotaxis protein CheB [Hyphomicrobiales bacterium]|nr:chemotaxis protein CheB [Hyphomicrobiales bacterium]
MSNLFASRERAEMRMANRDILAIGTSAGGFEALRFLAREFPPDLRASVLCVIHMPSHHTSSLDSILTQEGPLPASFARDGEKLKTAHIYIGPPASHLIVRGDRVQLGNGPRENHSRPSIDPLFRSTALCCGSRAIGVVLTGTLGDGASGLASLKRCGGITVVQDPSDAAFPEMPATALDRAQPDHVTSLKGMPALLQKLVNSPAGPPTPVPDEIRYEVGVARGEKMNMKEMDRIGRRSVLACPDCHGVMWEIDDGELIRYRCHVGHAYTAELMSLAIDENLSRAMASALRALDERIALAEKLRHQAQSAGRRQLAEIWAGREKEAAAEAKIIRNSIARVEELTRK